MTDIIKLPTSKRAGNQSRKAKSGLWPTAAAGNIANVALICRSGNQLGLVTGPSGSGKTTAVRQAVKAVCNEDDGEAFYLAMTPAAEGLQPGLLRIANAVGASCSVHAGANDLHDVLAQHRWPEGTLLVLDEAQFMSDALLHGIRSIWDELDQRGRAIGILLVGTSDLADRIEGRIARKSKPFEALRGRLGVAITVGRPESKDFAAISEHLGIAGPQAESILAAVGGNAGGLHNLRRLISHAVVLAGDGADIGLSDLKRAAAAMGGRA